MKTNYTITGMTCSSCEAKVTEALKSVKHVTDVSVSKDTNSGLIQSSKPIGISELQAVLDNKYTITSNETNTPEQTNETSKSWFSTYKPILLIFGFITAVVFTTQWNKNQVDWMESMRFFMAGFFLTFSFFKLLDLKGFASSYVMYDVIAKKIPAWAYLYAFIELFLGFAYLLNFYPTITYIITLVVMSVSIIGVLQAVLNKQRIKCACLGAVFNLPMSTVTIIEDGLMIVMSAIMLYFI